MKTINDISQFTMENKIGKTLYLPSSTCHKYLANTNSLKDISQFTMEEKVGQLFCLPSSIYHKYPATKNFKFDNQHHLGSIMLLPLEKELARSIVKMFHSQSNIPLLIGSDLEYGAGHFFKHLTRLPSARAIGDSNLSVYAEKAGEITAIEGLSIGIHWNFFPVLDVNDNNKNPIINIRSFGEETNKVIGFTKAYVKGMHKYQMISLGKHFPGNGNTSSDPHLEPNIINMAEKEFRKKHLSVFRELIKFGINTIMPAHQINDYWDKEMATFSSKLLVNILRKELNFTGVVISDALIMKSVTNKYSPVEASYKALMAGNDVLLSPVANNLDEFEEILEFFYKQYYSNSRFKQRVEESFQRIWNLKKQTFSKVNPFYLKKVSPSQQRKHELISDEIRNNSFSISLPYKNCIKKGVATKLYNIRFENKETIFDFVKEKGIINLTSIRLNKAITQNFKQVFLVLFAPVTYFDNTNGFSKSDLAEIKNLLEEKPNNITIIIFGNPYLKNEFDHKNTIISADPTFKTMKMFFDNSI